MRQNVLDWVTAKVQSATTAVVLTHNIDFLFVQSILLPRLRHIGHPRLTIFADAACAAATYDQQHRLLTGLGTRYRVVPVDLGPGRRFHPKAIFLAGKSNAALAVGSGNLTHGGWSANREIWSDFATDSQEGLAAVAAFKAYLQQILGLIPMRERVEEQVIGAFSPQENPWATDLPEPAGLLGSPAPDPLLDRIARDVRGGIESVIVCAPYFDPTAEALRQIAVRFSAPVAALLQPGRVGLAKSAAKTLPETITLKSISEKEGARFIHAKLFAFQGRDSTLLVVGSANCSKAALLAGLNWGNAELVAVQNVEHRVVDELLADFEIKADPPELPAEPPEDDWNFKSVPLRILAVRYVDATITVSYKLEKALKALWLQSEMVEVPISIDLSLSNQVRLPLRQAPELIRLKAVLLDNTEIVSAPCWVDNEQALGTTPFEQRLRAKLSDLTKQPRWSTSDYVEILELFDQHLRHANHRPRAAARKDQAKPDGARYTLDDVFSETFGTPPPVSIPGVKGQFDNTDFFRLFASFFSTDTGTADSAPPDRAESDNGEDLDPETEAAKLRKKSGSAQNEQPTGGERLAPKLRKTLEQIEKALVVPEFLDQRPPDRIAGDVGSLALVLTKSLVDGVLPRDEFRHFTRRLWAILFFGTQGKAGVIPRRLNSITSEQERTSFIQAQMSPRLTAALALWCFPEWQTHDSEAAWFRLSAGLLAVEYPWLSQGGTPGEVSTELSRISRSLLRDMDQDILVSAWRQWVRASIALHATEEAFGKFGQKELADLVRCQVVEKGELLWQSGCFCTAERQYARDHKTHADVRPLGSLEVRRFLGNWLAPVSDLLRNLELKIPEPVRREMLSLVEGINFASGESEPTLDIGREFLSI